MQEKSSYHHTKIEAFEIDIISWQTMPEAAICFHELEKHILVGWHPFSRAITLLFLYKKYFGQKQDYIKKK